MEWHLVPVKENQINDLEAGAHSSRRKDKAVEEWQVAPGDVPL